jgi:hypothetical protein
MLSPTLCQSATDAMVAIGLFYLLLAPTVYPIKIKNVTSYLFVEGWDWKSVSEKLKRFITNGVHNLMIFGSSFFVQKRYD